MSAKMRRTAYHFMVCRSLAFYINNVLEEIDYSYNILIKVHGKMISIFSK